MLSELFYKIAGTLAVIALGILVLLAAAGIPHTLVVGLSTLFLAGLAFLAAVICSIWNV